MKKITPHITATAKKTPSQRGKWVFRPLRSVVVTCACGNKYIVTRKGQVKCVNCTYGKVE